jgi:hypothetical protein
MGLFGERWYSNLIVFSTNFTRSASNREINKTLNYYAGLFTPLKKKHNELVDREKGPINGVRSVTGICKHHKSKILQWKKEKQFVKQKVCNIPQMTNWW